MHWEIPRISGGPLSVSLEAGRPLFVVGANGSGKSALIQYLTRPLVQERFIRISAHRQTWLQSGLVSITPKRRSEIRERDMQHERMPSARWQDPMGEGKLSATLYDLVAKENQRNQRIADCAETRDYESVDRMISQSMSPFKRINELLALGALPVSLEKSENEEICARREGSNAEFSIAQMSDGERNAAILAAQVLTAKEGIVLLIDEPERHLHRSIIEPFLAALFAQREDCLFVVATHDIALPISNPNARVLVTRSCAWSGEAPAGWDIQFLPESKEDTELPENVKRAILGARRKILFVEGSPDSLDQALYRILFPDIAVVPAKSCREVQKAVAGLRRIQARHDIEAFGLIDRDDRPQHIIEELDRSHVFTLGVCAVEALYYCSDSVFAATEEQARLLGNDSETMIETALKRAFHALEQQNSLAEEMAARRCERRLRDIVWSQIPKWDQIRREDRAEITVPIDYSPYRTEVSRFNDLVAEKTWSNWDDLITYYPLHKSSVFAEMARALKFLNKGFYEQAVRTQVQRDGALARRLRRRIGQFAEKGFSGFSAEAAN